MRCLLPTRLCAGSIIAQDNTPVSTQVTETQRGPGTCPRSLDCESLGTALLVSASVHLQCGEPYGTCGCEGGVPSAQSNLVTSWSGIRAEERCGQS